jgi:choline monooxygenase
MRKTWTNEAFERKVALGAPLDASWYLDPAVYDLEMERIFARTWQPVARLGDLSKPGDFVTADIAGEPIVATCDLNGQLRAYYNVCPHRAGALARGKGNRKSLQCLYHGWTFGLDGKLERAPGMDGTQDFETRHFCLNEVSTATWGPYLFVNLDPNALPLEAMWGDLFSQTSGINLNEWRLVESAEYLVDCNWKVYMDNYAEGYHVPMAHPSLNREVNLDEMYVDVYRFHSTQWAPVKSGGNRAKRRYPNPQPGDMIRYHVVFPNFMIDDYPDNLSVNTIKPVSIDKTLLTFEWFFREELSEEQVEGMVKMADEIQYEDIEICEYVQQNLKSRSYRTGRFSARHENGVHHFQALVHEFVNNDIITLEPPAENAEAGMYRVFPRPEPA